MDVLGSEVPEETDLAALWDEYKRRRSRAARNRLLLTYAPLVRYVADRVAIALPPNVDVDDLVSQGVQDRKSTRLNSSHVKSSYAVFCLKKKRSSKIGRAHV